MDRLVASSEGVVSRADLKYYCLFHPILLSDKKNPIPETEKNRPDKVPSPWAIDRSSKIKMLLESCIDDKFIEPVIQEIEVPDKNWNDKKNINVEIGLRPTSKGTDLLRYEGIIEAFFGKNSRIIAAITGAFGILIIQIILHALGINIQ